MMQPKPHATFEEGTSAEGLPTYTMALPISVLAANVAVGFAKSNGEAKRAIANGAIRLNDIAVADDKATVSAGDLNADGVAKLSMGKKNHVLIKQT
jgi:tyrosyl-tRNA synthetase